MADGPDPVAPGVQHKSAKITRVVFRPDRQSSPTRAAARRLRRSGGCGRDRWRQV